MAEEISLQSLAQEDSSASNTSTVLHIILFYKYVELKDPNQTAQEQHAFCERHNLLGRILVSEEGINATLSSSTENVNKYISYMVNHPEFDMTEEDFKHSKLDLSAGCAAEAFPELAVKVVAEIVSTGGVVARPCLPENERGYLNPSDFHAAIKEGQEKGDTVVLDVRNHKEYLVGHFENAVDPAVRTFSEYYKFLEEKRDILENKKILMYCTGGIRCEKASNFLRSKGFNDVHHLKGGIHKYLEAYPSGGFFKGKNFVFDKRVLMGSMDDEIVGKCIECSAPFDTFQGCNVCTVCRDLVLVCPPCKLKLEGELHCDDHQYLKDCYFTFIQYFSEEELEGHLAKLEQIFKEKENAEDFSKNKRRTLRKQIAKVESRLQVLRDGQSQVQPREGIHCRTCKEINCRGNCWGFWKEL